MDDIERKAWREALQYAFDQADKYPWNKSQNYRDYAIENKDKLYPNKVIYQWAIEYLNKNYSKIYEEEVKVNTGVGKEMNDYLASKGAKSVILNKSNENIIKFKSLLEYFVSHLEWVVNENSSIIGYSRYIKPLIDSDSFKKTGQGYAGAKIQDQIKEWESYDFGEISINIQPNYGDYKTVKCYLNWKGTGINIVARWKEDKIVSLYQDEFIYWEEPTRRVNLEVEFSLQELELFDNNQIGQNLISFYDSFVRTLEKRKYIDKQNELMKTVLHNKKILEYKKQIILQGPPGTGKTREAKKIAEELIGITLEVSDLKQYFKVGQKINSTSGIASYYDILEVHADRVTIKNEKAVENREITLQIILDTIHQIKNNQADKTRVNYAYESALANYLLKEVKFHKDNEQFKLIQFHPSYTYEDFVRGIVTETKGDKIEYKNVNKILGEFAEKALSNYKASIGSTAESNIDVWIDNNFKDFKNNIQAKLPEDETLLTGDISIFEVNDDHFKYAKKWQSPGYLKFSEFKALVKSILQNEIDLSSSASKLNKDKFLHAHYRYTYYNALLNKFFNEYNYEVKNEKVDLKNYVLIIDEINRANLSSVLGELIYALEYRGEAVESMYAVEGDNKLTLPPNLYIIGTMNTADRSVGHIDYAIRRRFAFVDVLPKNLTAELDNDFMIDSFEKVTSLFLKNYNRELDYNEDSTLIERSEYLTNDFDPKDVWLGHSYFIKQYEKDENGKNIEDNPIDFELRKKYEIKPILEEYVKDGILKESAKEVINSL